MVEKPATHSSPAPASCEPTLDQHEMVHGQGSSCIIRRRGFGAIWRQFQAPCQAQSRANCYPISLPL